MFIKEKTDEYIEIICKEVYKAQENKAEHTYIYKGLPNSNHRNEFILFIKPEITLKNDPIKLREIVKLVFEKINEFNLEINMIKVLPGKYLDDYNIMAQHYGVINKLSNNVKNEISETGKEKFKEIYGLNFSEADVYGGHEFLKQFPEFTAYTLSFLWQNSGFQKLTSGTYAGKLTYNGHDYYLVNGFHPFQLLHFNDQGRSIIVFSISGDLDWAVARNDFIGVTDPSNANIGSIRHELLKQKETLDIPVLNSAFNGVHLSAGPVEALNELIRFSSNFANKSEIKKMSDFRIGNLLLENFNQEQIKKILENEKVEHDGHIVSSFDLTEEKNTDDMVQILKPYY